jgi:hypothetical protein
MDKDGEFVARNGLGFSYKGFDFGLLPTARGWDITERNRGV